MRVWAVLVLAVLGLAPRGALADEAIERVIEGQIEAFQADDLEGAFEFASPAIRGIFGTAENFGVMVREGYPMIWRPSDLRFGALRKLGGRRMQTVMVTDQSGHLFIADYEMIETSEGWQINGVSIREAEEPSV